MADQTLIVSQPKAEQIGGTHYSAQQARCPHCFGNIAHWDLFAKAGYLVGNATKYLARYGLKPGEDQMENLLKARSYLDKQIEVLVMERRLEADQTLQNPPSKRIQGVKGRKGLVK